MFHLGHMGLMLVGLLQGTQASLNAAVPTLSMERLLLQQLWSILQNVCLVLLFSVTRSVLTFPLRSCR